MTQKRTVIQAFIDAVPNKLAENGRGLVDTSALMAFQPHEERHLPDREMKRALALADRAARVWAADAVAHQGQDISADRIRQTHIRSPEEAHYAEGLLGAAKGSATGWAKQALHQARFAADEAAQIVDDIPGVDNSEQLLKVAERAAACLADWASELNDTDAAVEIAIQTADELTMLR